LTVVEVARNSGNAQSSTKVTYSHGANGEVTSVRIWTVPQGHEQGRNTCGPNSAWRVISASGGTATQQELITAANRTSVLSAWGLGTTGQTLTEVMNANRRGLGKTTFSLSTGRNIDHLLEQVAQGKPVVAMLGVQDYREVDLGPITNWLNIIIGRKINRIPLEPSLHWVAVTGFDRASERIFYTATDGKSYSDSMAAFSKQFNWRFDDASQKAAQAVGVTRGTMIVGSTSVQADPELANIAMREQYGQALGFAKAGALKGGGYDGGAYQWVIDHQSTAPAIVSEIQVHISTMQQKVRSGNLSKAQLDNLMDAARNIHMTLIKAASYESRVGQHIPWSRGQSFEVVKQETLSQLNLALEALKK